MHHRKITVLVTGVGAVIGYGIVRTLKKSQYDVHVVGIDIFDDAVGQAWCDVFVQGIPAASDGFIDFISSVIQEHGISLVIPGIEQDLESFITHFENLPHIPFVLNNRELFSIFHSKLKTYAYLDGLVPLIETLKYSESLYDESCQQFGLPFVLKQDISYASKGFACISDKQDFEYYLHRFGRDCMAQKKMEIRENEYTCSIFGLGDGRFVNPTCLARELASDGSTKKAHNIVIDSELHKTIDIIATRCCFTGPTNLQFIKEDNKYFLLEINPRISSSTSIREIFGVNEAEMCIDYFLKGIEPLQKNQTFGKVVRYTEDQLFDRDTI